MQICKRYHLGNCLSDNCQYFHVCNRCGEGSCQANRCSRKPISTLLMPERLARRGALAGRGT
eukprot:4972449-Heterocapsa_arctica.AAC.1